MDSGNNENWRVILTRMEYKINQLETQIQRIERSVNPPWWKIILKFIPNNFFTILILVFLLLMSWKAWEFYQTLSGQFQVLNGHLNEVKNVSETIKNIPQNAGNSIQGVINSFFK